MFANCASCSTHDDAQLFINAYSVTYLGNFEGKNILYVARDLDVLAAIHNVSVEEVVDRRCAPEIV
jgi:uncharacterized protein YyaL (SSP411 family)